MKGGKAGVAIFVPKDDEGDDEESSADDEKDEETSKDDLSELLGNAFDAYEDGDRAGFVRSMKAAIRTA